MKRGRIEIIRDILHFISSVEYSKITKISNNLNLNLGTCKKYLEGLRNKGFLKIRETITEGKNFRLTTKGQDLLDRLEVILTLVEGVNP